LARLQNVADPTHRIARRKARSLHHLEPAEDHRLARVLVGGAVRRKRLRRLLLAHLIRERADDDDGEGVEGDDDEGGEGIGRLGKAAVLRSAVRRRRLRRLVLARVLGERAAA
jgi:hypothetical protein